MEKKWFVGIDVSKKTIDVVYYERKRRKICEEIHRRFSNDQSGFKLMRKWFKECGMKSAELVIGLENTGIYSLDLCLSLESAGIDYCCFNPLHLKRSFGLTRGKNDKVDAWRIAYYCYLHREDLAYCKMSAGTIMRLRELSSERRRHVKHMAEYKAYLTDRKARVGDNTLKRTAKVLEYEQVLVEEIEKEMENIIKNEPDLKRNYDLLLSVKGVGTVNAIAMIIHTNNFESFENARKYACYVGVAPFGSISGTSFKGKPHVCSIGARILKSDLSMAPRSARIHDPQMKEYFERKTAQGKEFGVVMNAIKYKLIQRMFAVVKRGTPFVQLQTFKRNTTIN